MCRIALLFPLLLLILSIPLGEECEAAGAMKIAIVAFDPVNDIAKDEGWGRQIAEMLITAAVNGKRFEVVERHLLEKIMSEQSMGARDSSFTSAAQSIGNMVGADYLLSGTIFKGRNGQMRVEARLVDVASGQILFAQSLLSSEDLGELSKKSDKMMLGFAEAAYGGKKPVVAGATGGRADEFAARFYLASKSGLVFTLNPEDELTADESYYLTVDVPRPLHVYIAQIDSRGDLYPIFPNPEFSSRNNPLSAGSGLRFPDKDFFFLDDNTGKERIHILAFDRANKDAESCFNQASSGRASEAATAFEALAAGTPAGNKASIWFWHR